jgi:hypothetical protein
MPRPYVVSVGEGIALTSGTNVPLPVHREDDILVFAASYRNGNISALTGFTKLIDNTNGTASFSVWWKRAVASESDPEITETITSSNRGFWMVIRGAATSGDPFEQAAHANRTSADPQSLPQVTVTAGAGVIGFWSTPNNVNVSAWDLDGAGGGRTVVDIRNFSSTGLAVGYTVKASAGTFTGFADLVSATSGSVGILAVLPDSSEPAATTAPTPVYGTTQPDAGSPTTINLPATATAGETILLIVTSRETLEVTTPTGYQKSIATGLMWAFHKVAVGGETSVSLTHTNSGNKFSVLPILVPGSMSSVSSDGTLSGTALQSRYAVDAASTGLLIAAAATNVNVLASAQTTAVQGALTERVDYVDGTANARSLWVADRTSEAGPIGRVGWTWASSATGGVMLFQMDAPATPPSSGGNRMGGTGAIRKPPRR